MNGGDTSENGEVTIGDGDPDPSETLRILVATDNHLGFGEKYPERQNDSYIGECLLTYIPTVQTNSFLTIYYW